MSVDFPAPFSPRRACTSPRCRSKSTRSLATTPGKRLTIPFSSRRGASLMRSRSYGGGRRVRPRTDRFLLDLVERGRRVDLPALQVHVRLGDRVLHALRHVSVKVRQQLRIGELLHAVEIVDAALERALLEGLDDLVDRALQRLQRARDHAVALRRLVDVDADRELALLAGPVESAEPALPGDLEDNVRPLIDLVDRDLLAFCKVLEVLRVGVQGLHAGLRVLHGLLRSEEHTSELQSRENLVCRLLLEKKKKNISRFVVHKKKKKKIPK